MAPPDHVLSSENTSTAPSLIQNSQTTSSLDLAPDEKLPVIEVFGKAASVRPIHGWKWVVACISIYTTALLYGLDTTIAADVQPNIVKSLGDIEKLTWVGVGFPLGSVAIAGLPITERLFRF